ncbi:hypothetical protein [Barnesiella intestinihominis]|uniref:hypothetical protein n=1 Tax=Barnesiella intestinihominis TaxID=487174 RepID=UPI003967AAF5
MCPSPLFLKINLMKLEFISIRIASKGYTVYKMSPMTATRIMTVRDVNKDPDESKACISAMAHSIALAVVGSRNIFAGVRVWFLRRRFMKRGTFNELFDCYQKILLMIPLEDIASVAAVMEGLSATISKDHE